MGTQIKSIQCLVCRLESALQKINKTALGEVNMAKAIAIKLEDELVKDDHYFNKHLCRHAVTPDKQNYGQAVIMIEKVKNLLTPPGLSRTNLMLKAQSYKLNLPGWLRWRGDVYYRGPL